MFKCESNIVSLAPKYTFHVLNVNHFQSLIGSGDIFSKHFLCCVNESSLVYLSAGEHSLYDWLKHYQHGIKTLINQSIKQSAERYPSTSICFYCEISDKSSDKTKIAKNIQTLSTMHCTYQ